MWLRWIRGRRESRSHRAKTEEWGFWPVEPEDLEKYIPGARPDAKGIIAALVDTHRCDTIEEPPRSSAWPSRHW